MTGCHCCAVLKSLRILTCYLFPGHRLIWFNYTARIIFRRLAEDTQDSFPALDISKGTFFLAKSQKHSRYNVGVMNKTRQLLSREIHQLWGKKGFSIVSNFQHHLCNKSHNLSKGDLNVAELLPKASVFDL